MPIFAYYSLRTVLTFYMYRHCTFHKKEVGRKTEADSIPKPTLRIRIRDSIWAQAVWCQCLCSEVPLLKGSHHLFGCSCTALILLESLRLEGGHVELARVQSCPPEGMRKHYAELLGWGWGRAEEWGWMIQQKDIWKLYSKQTVKQELSITINIKNKEE